MGNEKWVLVPLTSKSLKILFLTGRCIWHDGLERRILVQSRPAPRCFQVRRWKENIGRNLRKMLATVLHCLERYPSAYLPG